MSSAPTTQKSAPGLPPNAPSTPISDLALEGAPPPNEAEPQRPIDTTAFPTPTTTAGKDSTQFTTSHCSYSRPNIALSASCWKNTSDWRQLPPTSQKSGLHRNNKEFIHQKNLELSTSSQSSTPHHLTAAQGNCFHDQLRWLVACGLWLVACGLWLVAVSHNGVPYMKTKLNQPFDNQKQNNLCLKLTKQTRITSSCIISP